MHRSVDDVVSPPVDSTRRRLALLDEIAAAFVESEEALVFRAATNERERDLAYSLRARAVRERGWLEHDPPAGWLEHDEFDHSATLIGGFRGPELIAAARLIWPDEACGTPLSTEFGIVPQPAGAVVHLDRICIAREHTDPTGSLLTGLIGACWQSIRSRGFCRFSGIDSAAVTRLYRRAGFQVSVIGEPRQYWGERRYPIVFDPVADRGAADGLIVRFETNPPVPERAT